MNTAEKVTSRHNPEIVRIKKLLTSTRMRQEEGELVCDGAKLLAEASSHSIKIDTIIVRDGYDINLLPECSRILIVPEDLLEYVSLQKSPNDILFTCSFPKKTKAFTGKTHIILENVQDPGNIGTVIRTASAFGLENVILLGDCADPYGPKAARASMGAIFRIPISFADYEETAVYASKHDIYAAALGEGCSDLRDVNFDYAALAIGSEGRGLSKRLLELCTKRVRIPMTEDCESLNAAAAAAVLMWELCGKYLARQ